MELSELEPPDEDVEAAAAAAAAAAEGDGAAGPTYTKLRPDLHDSDLVLENSEEKSVVVRPPKHRRGWLLPLLLLPSAFCSH